MQRLLDPSVLAGISGLDLVAKTVVEGFLFGLHRSRELGFSQEFAEYRAYTPGDDLRQVDWNVFARTERCYLKRYWGETNTRLTVLLDASASMRYTSHGVTKIDYARFAAAVLFYLTTQTQRDAAGLIVFDEELRQFIRPSTRPGQLHRLLGGLENAKPGARTDFTRPIEQAQQFLRRRGFVVIISDFYAPPEAIIHTLGSLRSHGNEVMLFHVLDPNEIRPTIGESAVLQDMETEETLEVDAEYAQSEYRRRMDAHLEALRARAHQAGMDYCLLATNRPLDGALREYLSLRQGRN